MRSYDDTPSKSESEKNKNLFTWPKFCLKNRFESWELLFCHKGMFILL